MAATAHAVAVTDRVASVFNTFWEWEPEAPALGARCRAYSDSMLLRGGDAAAVPCKGEDIVSASTSCASSGWDTDSDAESAQCSMSLHYDTDDEVDDAPRFASQGWRSGLVLQSSVVTPQHASPAVEVQRAHQGSAKPSRAPKRCSKCSRTTLILKGLPRTVTRAALCHALDAAGFAGLYDFLYLPVNFKTWRFFRYCTVNFVREEIAQAALERLGASVLQWPVSVEDEDLAVQVAWCEKAQGLAVHVEQYRNSPVMHESVPDDYKPMLLRNGRRIAFPPPTTALTAPNTRKSQ